MFSTAVEGCSPEEHRELHSFRLVVEKTAKVKGTSKAKKTQGLDGVMTWGYASFWRFDKTTRETIRASRQEGATPSKRTTFLDGADGLCRPGEAFSTQISTECFPFEGQCLVSLSDRKLGRSAIQIGLVLWRGVGKKLGRVALGAVCSLASILDAKDGA